MKTTTNIFNVLALLISITALSLSYSEPQRAKLSGVNDVVVDVKAKDSDKLSKIGEDGKTNPLEDERYVGLTSTNEYLIRDGFLKSQDGGTQMLTGITTPPCNESMRGTIWFVSANEGDGDALVLCGKNNKETYSWTEL
jgi:hypothetical protein